MPAGTRNRECLSLGCDNEPLFSGRSPLELYRGFIEAFADSFDYLFGGILLQSSVHCILCQDSNVRTGAAAAVCAMFCCWACMQISDPTPDDGG